MNPTSGKRLHYADACVLYLSGLSTTQVARQLGSTGPTVLRALAHYGLEPRSISDAKSLRSRGNRRVDSGYVTVSVGKYRRKKEHVLIAEGVLGRELRPGEIVHHINENKLDNRNENLLICTNSYHIALHHRMRTHPDWNTTEERNTE